MPPARGKDSSITGLMGEDFGGGGSVESCANTGATTGADKRTQAKRVRIAAAIMANLVG
jgi:hypothetical protein